MSREVVQPEIVIEAGGPALSIRTVREFVAYWDVFLAFTSRHIKVKYKQMALGLAWTIIQPLATTILLATFLGRFAHVQSEGIPYLPFALVGMVAWTFFATAVTFSAEALIRDQGLLRKVYFPREILPLSNVAASIVDLIPGLVLVLVVAVVSHIQMGFSILFAPLGILLLIVLASAVGLFLAAANVFFRDVRYLLPFLLQFGLLASPIAYAASVVPNHSLRTAIEVLNPISAAIETLRATILLAHTPDWAVLGMSAVWTGVLFAGALWVFKALEPQFADRV